MAIDHRVIAQEPTESSGVFLRGMVARMDVSYHKYGPVQQATMVDALASLRDRLKLYEETGNTEWLIDAANFAMIEFMYPRHPDAHYRPTEAGESPGRIGRNVGRTHKDNRTIR